MFVAARSNLLTGRAVLTVLGVLIFVKNFILQSYKVHLNVHTCTCRYLDDTPIYCIGF